MKRLALLVLLVVVPPAQAQDVDTIRGTNAPGPAQYDRTKVLKFAPSKAKRVLVLVPGTYGGAGNFRLVARDIARRVRGLQVWAWDRRTNALEDTSVFRTGNPTDAFNYYLNFRAVR